ncbi:MAG: ATP-binding protein, partial [Paludibacter sp.]
YLGSKKHIDQAYDAFKIWDKLREKNIQKALKGNIEEVKNSIAITGDIGKLREDMLRKIQVISDFALNKSVSLNQTSSTVNEQLSTQLITITFIVIILTFFISAYLVYIIRKPLLEIINVTKAYRSGNLEVRCKNEAKNEIGDLARAFNDLLHTVHDEKQITDKIEKISDAMMSLDNAHSFFKQFLPVFASETNSVIGAFYLINEAKNGYYLYESVGLSTDSEKNTFSANTLEGEFGAVLATRKTQFIKNIPLQTTFVFNTVSGAMIPREIVTIPIISGNEIIGIVSLAALRNYPIEIVQLIFKVNDLLNARIVGVLAYRAIRRAAVTLQEQNQELEIQRQEMSQQAAEMAQQNAELEIQKLQLTEASRLKTNFLSNMSHELRTPLNSVIALSGVLNRRLVNQIPDDEYSYLGVIERNGRHLLTLINDILDISRIESGREEIEISDIDTNELIEGVVEMIQPQAIERKIKLIQHRAEKVILLKNDSKKIRHILQNLIANAVKFTEKGSVEISIVDNDKTVKILVKDTGIGISDKHIAHIFDEFRQADGTTSRRFGGTGLGLSIARKYARLLGGDITVDSVPESGSVFTLVLPKVINETIQAKKSDSLFEPPKASSQIMDISNIKGKHILLVEDSEPAIIQIKDMLESNHYRVTPVRSGAEALDALNHFTPDAMILDLMMPGMDGFELLEKIRNFEKTKSVPVLILTAKHITPDDLKKLKNNNVHQLIQKGDVQKEALLQAVYAMVVKTETTDKHETRNVEAKMPKAKLETKKTILIVEDNKDNMITVKAVIGDKYHTLEAVNGVQGVEMAMEHKPDL